MATMENPQPCIPAEVIDDLIDHITYDPATASSLALVRRIWRRRVNSERFAKLIFKSPPDGSDQMSGPAKTFLDILSADSKIWPENEGVSQHVRVVGIPLQCHLSGYMGGKRQQASCIQDGTMASILNILHAGMSETHQRPQREVHIWRAAVTPSNYLPEILRIDFAQLDTTFTEALTNFCCHSKITTLGLFSIRNVPPAFLLASEIAELRLELVEFDNTADPLSLPSASEHLHTLVLKSSHTGLRVLRGVPLGCLPVLTTLTVIWGHIGRLYGVDAFGFSAFARQIKTLNIVMSFGFMATGDSIPDYSLFRALEKIKFTYHLDVHRGFVAAAGCFAFTDFHAMLPKSLPQVLHLKVLMAYNETWHSVAGDSDALLGHIDWQVRDKELIKILVEHCASVPTASVKVTFKMSIQYSAADQTGFEHVKDMFTGCFYQSFSELDGIPNLTLNVKVSRMEHRQQR